MQAVPAILGDRDVLASAPTGSGKTAAYMLPRAMFSATVHAGVEEAASSVLRDALVISVGRSMAAAAGVTQKLVFVGREEGKLVELRQMASSGFDPPVLVFFKTRERADDAFYES
ncbi:hypothetical protein FNF27_08336 [Cafeteria roenbergensis]|uniref:DEAD/DEAH-box helicase domain-containing protein n=1 Tax=Cafeteria roenbergensis TaxID=33653 RepID=A0A5A8D1S8_CAFRO|nr:hypothetical protein FNF27_08336 [Cafeteria roenbergensis]